MSSEYHSVEKPLIKTLGKLGWDFITQAENLSLRDGSVDEVFLKPYVIDALMKHNAHKGLDKDDCDQIYSKLKKIEDNELLEEGEKIGIGKLKTSTRNMIITVIMALGCLFAGIKVFQSSQMQLVTILEDKKIDIITNDSDRITKIEDSIDMLKNLIVTGVDK